MNSTSAYQWEQTRRKGLLRYILTYGPLIALGVLITNQGSKLLFEQPSLEQIIIACSAALIGGLGVAAMFWLLQQYRYEQFKSTNSSNE